MAKKILRSYYYKFLSLANFIAKKRYKNRVRVLAYHDVKDPEIFLKQLECLKAEYNVISKETFENHVFKNAAVPENSVLITFDDGDYSVLEKGLPLLRNLNLPAVLFIITDLIGTKKDFWWNRVINSYKKEERSNVELKAQLNHLKSVKNAEREKLLNDFDRSQRKQLSKENLQELQKSGIAIANHSDSHPMFNKCSTDEINLELERSFSFFENLSLGDYSIFAYPNGNFDIRSEKILQNKNVRLAFLFDHKINAPKINPMRISRIRINSDTPMDEFITKISGVHSMVFNLKR